MPPGRQTVGEEMIAALSALVGLATGLALCAARIEAHNRSLLGLTLQVDRLAAELAETSRQRDRALTQLVIHRDHDRIVVVSDDPTIC